METHTKYLAGSFRDRESAERAYNSLKERGYTDKEINIMMSNETRSKYFEHDTANKDVTTDFENKASGAGTGIAIGGIIGAGAGIIAALGTSLVIPGLGLVIAGPIAAGLAGAVGGSIVGAMISAGVPRDRALKYEDRIRRGDIFIGVQPRSDEDASILGHDWGMYEPTDVY